MTAFAFAKNDRAFSFDATWKKQARFVRNA
jgi:hypothetical protein